MLNDLQEIHPANRSYSVPGMPPGAPERAREIAETMPTVGQWNGPDHSPGADAIASTEEFEQARSGEMSRGFPYWQHACGHVEAFGMDWKPEDGGCDACESGSDDPDDWQPLYVRKRATRPHAEPAVGRPHGETGGSHRG